MDAILKPVERAYKCEEFKHKIALGDAVSIPPGQSLFCYVRYPVVEHTELLPQLLTQIWQSKCVQVALDE